MVAQLIAHSVPRIFAPEQLEPDSLSPDMDSSESPVHGWQEGSAYNGHFE
jgi:hypothetical protein